MSPLIVLLAGSIMGTDPLIVDRDIKLDPSIQYSSILVRGSNLTIEGQGTHIRAEFEKPAKERQGVGISLRGCKNVSIRNLKISGFDTGLMAQDGTGLRIEDCDFSDNFHDPDFDWGDQGRRGGIVFERIHDSTIERCRANRVWDGCVLAYSQGNFVRECDFSRTSNTCLKLWQSSKNRIENNNLSYGIRIREGEVHARDSTCVLIESGSDNNFFLKNDCRYGGDGIFIRVLNGRPSVGNRFEENDCSYANNNCFEAWSPRNTYVRNRANHGSYGFWLGASDETTLIENEASFNGLADGAHNSPHLPNAGHAGIVFMFGPSTHTILRGNRCEGNNGAGIALIGDEPTKGKRFRPCHWLIEGNSLTRNRWGIFASLSENVVCRGNQFANNSISDAELVAENQGWKWIDAPADLKKRPEAKIDCEMVARVGEPIRFDSSGSHNPSDSPLSVSWNFSEGSLTEEPVVTRTFQAPGIAIVSLTVANEFAYDLTGRAVRVLDSAPEIGDEAKQWRSLVGKLAEIPSELSGERTILATTDRAKPSDSIQVEWRPDNPLSVRGKTEFVFWLKGRIDEIYGWPGVNPVVTFFDEKGDACVATPTHCFLNSPARTEYRDDWQRIAIPFENGSEWTFDRPIPDSVTSVVWTFQTGAEKDASVCIDGLNLR